MSALEDYEFAQFAQQTDKELQRGIIAPDGSTIEMNGAPLSDAELSALKTAFLKISSIDDCGFACIAEAREAVKRAIILEWAARRTGLHLV
jgi:hypothetical protein